LSSSPGDDTYRISVKREPHGLVSAYLHSHLRPGSVLDVAAPRGEFVLADGSEPVLLLSAGIGVTPVLAMLHQLAATRSNRDVWWIHTARDGTQHPFLEEAHQLLQSLPRAHEHLFHTASTSGESEAAQPIPVTSGRPTLASLSGLGLPIDAAVYLCGPAVFMSAMHDSLVELGFAAERLHTEQFGTRPAINPGVTDAPHAAPHQPPGAPGAGPEITFARSGLTVRWSPRHRSLLELADRCDVPTRWSCRTGVCHTCVTPIISGNVSYDPSPLEMPGRDEALICCAQPTSDVVIDL
jgi:ferredoxin-NADP reductase